MCVLFLLSVPYSVSKDMDPKDEISLGQKIIQSEEAAAGSRFFAHLLTDPIEISRQLIPIDSMSWLMVGDVLRFSTIAYNLVHLNQDSCSVERVFELLHYVGDAGERIAVAYDYTGGLRVAMNVLQFGGVTGYVLTRLYKRYHPTESKQD